MVTPGEAHLCRLSSEGLRVFLGLSRITGERGADLEEEIFLVAVPVSATLDDLDGVVDPFDNAGIERMTAARQDAMPVALQTLCNSCRAAIPLWLACSHHCSQAFCADAGLR